MIFDKSYWIKDSQNGDCPAFCKDFSLSDKAIKTAKLYITAVGVYRAYLNDNRVGDVLMTPGWTKYAKRHQYQEYDITSLLAENNTLFVEVGHGWQRGRICNMLESNKTYPPASVIACLQITYQDGTVETVVSDTSWQCADGAVIRSDIYDGEAYDANVSLHNFRPVEIYDADKTNLIPQEGEPIKAHERIAPLEIIQTPAGETVINFGQNLTGYVEISVDAKGGEVIDLSFGEVLDSDGNFYNANYRTAKSEYIYTCRPGKQTYAPHLCFYGFQYVRINQAPENVSYTAVAVYSDIKQTGFLRFSDPRLNQLFSNVIWGNKGNFLDIPTDCPQRDERWGWTGDAHVFARTACYNFDVEKFYAKWLNDILAEQGEDGFVPHTIPNSLVRSNPDPSRWCERGSAVWGDVAIGLPWQVYLSYGDKEVLRRHFESMCKWIAYITNTTTDQYLWTGGMQYGDWLALDGPQGSNNGGSRSAFIASVFYAHCTSLVVKSGKLLGEDVSYYEDLYDNIVRTIRKTYPEYKTQTECVLAIHFHITEDVKGTADKLISLLEANGYTLTTGFVGTPYLLHALSETGHTDVAYRLLLTEDYPSWLFSVKMGATTMWEHWDGIREDGTFWSTEMNSYNHYAYGAVMDWVYSVAAGIDTDPDYPGYEKAIIAPNPNPRLQSLQAEYTTKHGTIKSAWEYKNGQVRYFISTPVETTVCIDGKSFEVQPGDYIF
ncbi:MAG: family 78 glycoside hydrolase catalytic domain [Clostridia bacterium]|nr:family 78 glycoside hydrolase catalytic domain [Clostridia bacterium]